MLLYGLRGDVHFFRDAFVAKALFPAVLKYQPAFFRQTVDFPRNLILL